MASDVVMDDDELALLDELQRDARISYSELSRRVHLSAPAVAERIRRMEDAGIIVGYHAQVDAVAARLGDPRHRADALSRQPSACFATPGCASGRR